MLYDEYFSIEEIATRLKCSKEKVYYLIKTNKLKAINIGMGESRARYVISETEYRRYLATITN